MSTLRTHMTQWGPRCSSSSAPFWHTSAPLMKPPCGVKLPRLSFLPARWHLKRRHDSCFHWLNGYASMSQNDFRVRRNHYTQQKASPMTQNPSVLGIGLAKRVFHVVGMDERGHVVLKKRLTREALLPV